jgi:hypothetical protein
MCKVVNLSFCLTLTAIGVADILILVCGFVK